MCTLSMSVYIHVSQITHVRNYRLLVLLHDTPRPLTSLSGVPRAAVGLQQRGLPHQHAPREQQRLPYVQHCPGSTPLLICYVSV